MLSQRCVHYRTVSCCSVHLHTYASKLHALVALRSLEEMCKRAASRSGWGDKADVSLEGRRIQRDGNLLLVLCLFKGFHEFKTMEGSCLGRFALRESVAVLGVTVSLLVSGNGGP